MNKQNRLGHRPALKIFKRFHIETGSMSYLRIDITNEFKLKFWKHKVFKGLQWQVNLAFIEIEHLVLPF